MECRLGSWRNALYPCFFSYLYTRRDCGGVREENLPLLLLAALLWPWSPLLRGEHSLFFQHIFPLLFPTCVWPSADLSIFSWPHFLLLAISRVASSVKLTSALLFMSWLIRASCLLTAFLVVDLAVFGEILHTEQVSSLPHTHWNSHGFSIHPLFFFFFLSSPHSIPPWFDRALNCSNKSLFYFLIFFFRSFISYSWI